MKWSANARRRLISCGSFFKFTMDNCVAFDICERDTNFHLDLEKMYTYVLRSYHLTIEFVNHKLLLCLKV